MASTLVQFRTDDKKKEQATRICESIGIELPDYLRMCMSRLIIEGGIPFSMNTSEEIRLKAIKAVKSIQEEAKRNGTSSLTSEEIDSEIRKVRKKK